MREKGRETKYVSGERERERKITNYIYIYREREREGEIERDLFLETLGEYIW